MQGKFDELSDNVNAANEAKEVAEIALAQANEAHSKELSDLNAQRTEAIAKKDDELKTLTEAKDKEIADLTAAKTETEANLQGAKDALATAEQTIADKQAQIDELTHDAGTEQNAGEAPKNNGEGVKTPQLRSFDGSSTRPMLSEKLLSSVSCKARNNFSAALNQHKQHKDLTTTQNTNDYGKFT